MAQYQPQQQYPPQQGYQQQHPPQQGYQQQQHPQYPQGPPPPDQQKGAPLAVNPGPPGGVGVNRAFVFQQPIVLVMQEKFSFSGDDFTIRTAEGMDVLRCNGRAMSMSGRKEFLSPNGQPLFTLRKHHFSFPKSWYLEGPNAERFCELQGRWSFGKAKIDAKFRNILGNGEEVTLEVRGNFFDRAAEITYNGQCVAKISRDFFNMREFFANKQTYGVQVQPGVDAALIAALVVGVDEQRNEK